MPAGQSGAHGQARPRAENSLFSLHATLSRLPPSPGTLHHLGWIDVFANVAAPLLTDVQNGRVTLSRLAATAQATDGRSLFRTMSARKPPPHRPDRGGIPRVASHDSDSSTSHHPQHGASSGGLLLWNHDYPDPTLPRPPADPALPPADGALPSAECALPSANGAAPLLGGRDEPSNNTPPRRPWSGALGHGPARTDPLATGSAMGDGRPDPLIHYRVYVCGAGTASRPYFIELADFLCWSAVAAALEDEFELLVAVLNARLRQVDRHASTWRRALRAAAAVVEVTNLELHRAAPPSHPCSGAASRPASSNGAVMALGLVLLPNALPDKQLALFVGLSPPDRWSIPTGAVLLTPAVCDSTDILPGFDTLLPPLTPWLRRPPLDWIRRTLLLPAEQLSPLARLAAAATVLLLLTQLLLLAMGTSAVCTGSTPACATVLLLPPLAIAVGPIVGLWACLCVAADLLCGARGGGRLPFLRRSAPSTRNLKQLMEQSDGPQGALARADSLAGVVRSAMAYNAASTLAVCVLLLALALPKVGALFSTAQRWLLPCALLSTQALLCLALRSLAASAGMTSQMWELLVSIEAER